jgi:hypothetical protein
VKTFDITLTTTGYRVEVSDEIAENLQEQLARPDVQWLVVPGVRPGVELTWLNRDHVVSIDVERAR